MADTSIEWTDKTWTVRGCAIVSEGCRNCYAMKTAHRFSGKGGAYEGLTKLGAKGPVWEGSARFIPEMLDAPLRWKKPARIFVNSMSDLFHEDVTNEEIAEVFGIMAKSTRHTYQILTKRPDRMREWLTEFAAGGRHVWERAQKWPLPRGKHVTDYPEAAWPLPNVWLGVSVEHQAAAEDRIPELLATPAAVRFLSVEPLLGLIDLSFSCKPWGANGASAAALSRIGWVIVGGESGSGARPMNPEWVRSLREQCTRRGVPFFFKQWGAWASSLELDIFDPAMATSVKSRDITRFSGAAACCVGKKKAGRDLDGRTWDEMPAVRR